MGWDPVNSALPGAEDRLRREAEEEHATSALAALDPANVYGAASCASARQCPL